jgi:hypothetical protein
MPLLKESKILLLLITILFCVTSFAAKIPPKLEDAITIPDFKLVKSGTERSFKLPELPPKPGKILVLRCRMSSFGGSGCNNCARIFLNDTSLGMITSSGKARLLFRDLNFKLKEKVFRKMDFKVFKGANIVLPFAKDCDDADTKTTDNLGSYFVLDLTDAANYVDVNTITFRNIRVDLGGNNTLTIKDISIGYLPISLLPKVKTNVIKSAKSTHSFNFNGTKLDFYRNGGFSVSFPKLPSFGVETTLSMKLNSDFNLKVKDTKSTIKTQIRPITKTKVEFIATWPSVRLNRIISLNKDGRIEWFDKWTNTHKTLIQGIPFRYKTGLIETATRNYLSGSFEALETTIGVNSTIVYENLNKLGTGCAFVAEDDNSELILDAVNNANLVEIFTKVLALAPGKSFTLHYSITPIFEGGYWKFINNLRQRRKIGVNGVERPLFWGAEIPNIPGLSTAEKIKKNLGNLGPITIAFAPWVNLLSRDAIRLPRKKGLSAFEHQELVRLDQRKKLAAKIKLYKKLVPNCKILLIYHASMQVTYMPEFNQNPFSVSAIRNLDGTPYFHAGYDAITLPKNSKNWSLVYYLPLPGTPLYNQILEDVDYYLSQGADGFYFDEYSFRTPRNYRRYDYSAWDGFSSDLDENGKVKALKSDNCQSTIPFKSALEQKITSNGKILYGNGGECGRLVPHSKVQGFVEGTSSIYYPKAHLLHVPLILGNYGVQHTLPGVLKAVREALLQGCIYSPHNRTNWVVQGKDNFVCKLYPITVTEIGPGFVAGKERFITRKSGTFTWKSVANIQAELFVYNSKGIRINIGKRTNVVNGKIKLDVPANGLVIAEVSAKLSSK